MLTFCPAHWWRCGIEERCCLSVELARCVWKGDIWTLCYLPWHPGRGDQNDPSPNAQCKGQHLPDKVVVHSPSKKNIWRENKQDLWKSSGSIGKRMSWPHAQWGDHTEWDLVPMLPRDERWSTSSDQVRKIPEKLHESRIQQRLLLGVLCRHFWPALWGSFTVSEMGENHRTLWSLDSWWPVTVASNPWLWHQCSSVLEARPVPCFQAVHWGTFHGQFDSDLRCWLWFVEGSRFEWSCWWIARPSIPRLPVLDLLWVAWKNYQSCHWFHQGFASLFWHETVSILPFQGKWHDVNCQVAPFCHPKWCLLTGKCAPHWKNFLDDTSDEWQKKLFEAALKGCEGSLLFFHTLHNEGIWHFQPTAKNMAMECFKFCLAYQSLATLCHEKHMARFHLEPSLHTMMHFYVELARAGPVSLSPAISTTEMDEDFVGKICRTCRNTHALSTTRRCIDRYLLRCHHELEGLWLDPC